jgi:hypothetical protein
MTCAPFMCNGSPSCSDRQCPGHPAQLAEHSRIGVEEEDETLQYGVPSPDLPWGWIPDTKPSAWKRLWFYLAVVAVLFALAVICPTVPLR